MQSLCSTLSLLLLNFLAFSNNALKLPYVYYSFDHVHGNSISTNDPSVRDQVATYGSAPLSIQGSTSITTDNDGNQIGVFKCENTATTTKYTAAFIPPLTYDQLSLEVIASIHSFDEIFPGFLIGIDSQILTCTDSTRGNAISSMLKVKYQPR